MKNSQGGFGFLHILAIVLVLVVGAGYWKHASKKEAERIAAVTAEESARNTEEAERRAEERERKRNADKERKDFDERLAAEKQKSDYAKSAESLTAFHMRWADAVKVAAVTARISLAQQVSNLQAIRRDASGLILPSCLESAKTKLVSGMDLTIEGFMNFMGDTKNGEITSAPYFSSAGKALGEYRAKLNECEAVMKAGVQQ